MIRGDGHLQETRGKKEKIRRAVVIVFMFLKNKKSVFS